MCVVLVWPFEDGCFCEWFYKFFLQFTSLSPFFCLGKKGFGNGCCMENLQGFEGLVYGWGFAHLKNYNSPLKNMVINLNNFNQEQV
jgi:hypothetical protein